MDKIKLFILSTKNKIIKTLSIFGRFKRPRNKVKSFFNDPLNEKLVFSLSKTKLPTVNQLKQLPNFLSSKEVVVIKTMISIFFISIVVLGTNFYLNHIKIVPAHTGEYIEGVVGSPQYINPLFSQVNDVDSDLVKLIFSSLLRYDNETGELTPDLCEKYEISDDQKEYTFYLRDNIMWQDGEPLTIDDIIFTFELAKFKDVKSPLGASFNGVNIERIDDKTIKFTLTDPYAPFLSVLTFGILPKHIWEDVNLSNINLARYNVEPIGSGPYEVKSMITDKEGNIKSYLLTTNNNYYFKKPHIKDLTIVFFSGYNEAVDALKTKSIQGLSFIPQEFNESLSIKEHLTSHALPLPQYTAIFFNQEKNEVLKSKKLRKALLLAIDKNEIVDILMSGVARKVDSPFVNDEWIASEDTDQTIFDPTESMVLIEKLGYRKNEEDQFYNKEVKVDGKKERKDLTISITSVNSVKNAGLTEVIKNYWESVGVKTEIILLDQSEIKMAIENKDYETIVYGEMLGLDPDPYPFWHSSQIKNSGLNLANFNNKKADKLLEDARITTDKDVRVKKYTEFKKILDEEIPAIFLYQPIYDYKIDKNIKGVTISNIITPADRFSNIGNWYLKTKKEFSWK